MIDLSSYGILLPVAAISVTAVTFSMRKHKDYHSERCGNANWRYLKGIQVILIVFSAIIGKCMDMRGQRLHFIGKFCQCFYTDLMTTMNISLPDSMKQFVDERVATRGYGTYSEYVRDLIRKDAQEAAKDKLRSLLMEGLSSPPGRPWEELKADLLNRAKEHKTA